MGEVERVVNIVVRGVLLFAFMMCIGIQPKVQMYFLFYILGMVVDMSCIKALVGVNVIYKVGGGDSVAVTGIPSCSDNGDRHLGRNASCLPVKLHRSPFRRQDKKPF